MFKVGPTGSSLSLFELYIKNNLIVFVFYHFSMGFLNTVLIIQIDKNSGCLEIDILSLNDSLLEFDDSSAMCAPL